MQRPHWLVTGIIVLCLFFWAKNDPTSFQNTLGSIGHGMGVTLAHFFNWIGSMGSDAPAPVPSR